MIFKSTSISHGGKLAADLEGSERRIGMRARISNGRSDDRQGAIACLILLVVMFCLCPTALAGNKKITVQQPFSLQGEGIGGNPVETELMLSAQDEEPFVSRVLLHTIQGFQLSVVDRPQDTAEPLLPKHDYKTDIAPLTDEDIRKYNAVNSGELGLDPSLNFGLQYGISYAIQIDRNRFFAIEIESVLYAKGAATTKWRKYNGSYAGDFFANRFADALKNNFKTSVQDTKSPH